MFSHGRVGGCGGEIFGGRGYDVVEGELIIGKWIDESKDPKRII